MVLRIYYRPNAMLEVQECCMRLQFLKTPPFIGPKTLLPTCPTLDKGLVTLYRAELGQY